MRIHSGEARGRLLKTVEGKGTRPTDARARETLFNLLGERVIDARFLDLYAGTGSVGLEALSRGAEACIFVEQNAGACRVIRENVRVLGFQEKCQVWQTPVKSALHQMREAEEKNAPESEARRFDIVFADPPFNRDGEVLALCALLDKSVRLLHNEGKRFEGLLVIQHHRREKPQLESFVVERERRAGESLLSFFQPKL
jgi:16S rRNA (guanine966-N2)-methyltransferase